MLGKLQLLTKLDGGFHLKEHSCSHRAFQGPSDETALVEQAVLFGEMIQSNKESGVDFDSYFSVQYFSGDPTSIELQEIWFTKSD